MLFVALGLSFGLLNPKQDQMRTSTEYQEAIAELREELDAIVAVAEREERDLDTEQAKRCAEISDSLIPNLQTHYKTALSVERERMKMAESRFAEQIKDNQLQNGTLDASGNSLAPKFGPIKIPAKAKNHGPLKAFQGPDAERNAYIAGQVALAGIYGSQSAMQFCKNHGLQVSGVMTSGDNSKAGIFIPDEMSQAIIRLRENRGVFPRFAARWPMGSDIMRIPRLLADVTAHWVGEGQEITASDTTAGSAELMARKIASLAKVPSEVDEDAVIEVGDMITASMAYASADKIDQAGFNGDGTSTYGGNLGLKNALHANAIHIALGGNVSALTLDEADFIAVMGMYPDYPGAEPRWFMHRAVYYASAGRLALAAGGNTTVTMADGVSEVMWLGYPVTFTQVLPSTTGSAVSTILAYFGDLRLGAAYGVRRNVRTEVTLDRYFEEDLVGIKTTERVAINVHERGETINERPIVALETAAA